MALDACAYVLTGETVPFSVNVRNGNPMFFSANPRVLGHRGWPARFPDNSAAGLAAALREVGSVETDVRRTADGVLVLSHDPTLGGHVVSQTDWEVLSEVDLGGGERPVSLAVLLEDLARDLPLNLEVKNSQFEAGFESDGQIALDVAAVARPFDLLSSFHWPTMDAVRRSGAVMATGLLLDDPVPIDAAISHALSVGHSAVIPNWKILVRDLDAVDRAGRRGLEVVCWTVNDGPVAAELVRAGVAAIITDDPGAMKAALAEELR